MEISSSHLLVFLFSALCISSLLCQQVIAADDDEQTILLKLRNDWRNPLLNSHWNSSNGSHCNWRGITCRDGLVTGIILRLMNITSQIPPSICDFKNLTNIDLSNNEISGKFPISLFNCSKLQTLDLSQNNFMGQIPSDIDRISTLRLLNLSANNFSGHIPPSIGHLPNLRILRMNFNRLNGEIPASIGTIPSLIIIHLSNNKLTGALPPELGLHSKIEELDLSENQLTGDLPSSLEKCPSLTTVRLNNNRFSGEIGDDFWLLNNLSTLILRDNFFSGKLPSYELGSNLISFDISNNRFSGGIPSQIAGSTRLSIFKASNNLISGEIPSGLPALSHLNTLSLDGNRLSGRIPSTIISWNSLDTMNLSRNHLSGELPPEMGFLASINVLDLSDNQISGEIPSEFVDLKFNFLNLSSNRLTGKIPVEYEDQTFARSFLNNSGLCTGRLNLNHEACLSGSRHSHKLSPRLLTMVLIISGAIILVVLVFILFMIRHSRRRKKHKQDLPIVWKLTLFQMVEFTELDILSSLTEDNVIGSGASGQVYRVQTNQTNNTYVAVKKIWSRQLEKHFQAEVEILGTIRHSRIVKLLCSISSENSKLLVYEYMENGSLDEWLHDRKQGSLDSTSPSALDWPRRLEIAIGAAQGLCYLHHNCCPPIIHRDVKSSNILLDSEFKARIADFGLAKMVLNHGDPKTASVVAGSFGYIAPEYARTTKINEKIDIYSFGVVLLELATGRKATHGDEHTCLAEWAWRQHQEGNSVDDVLDEYVKQPCYLDEMRMVYTLGLICTSSLPSDRPSMKQILQILQRRYPVIGAYIEEELLFQSDVIVGDTEIELTLLNNV